MRPSLLALVLALTVPAAGGAQSQRSLRPTDLFSIEEIGPTRWSPDGAAISVEFLKSDRWVDFNVPTSDVRVLEVGTRQWRTIGARGGRYLGFFGAAWSPNGRSLLMLSVDTQAVVRPWVWVRGASAPRLLRGIELSDGLADEPAGLWSDDDHALFLMRDTTQPVAGGLYARISTHRNAADRWRTAHAGATASVTVMASGGKDTVVAVRRLVSVDVRTGVITTLASGDVHHPSLSTDRRTLTYWRQRPSLRASIDTALFGANAAEADYLRLDWGNERHAVDLRTGRETTIPLETTPARRDTSWRPPPAPRAGARLRAQSSIADAALYLTATDTSGTSLWLARRGVEALEIWKGNAWVRDVRGGEAEHVTYADSAGRVLHGWVLFPPGPRVRQPLPAITIVYPGTMHTAQAPTDVSIRYRWYQNPQLFAALGYVVVLPSIPYPDKPMQADMIAPLAAGILPLIDTVVARGIVDRDRIAILGQSAGGYAVQAIITQTDRFRSAIATAGYSNLVSLYGTFYGQYRHGDSGDPQLSTALRMMQFERGYYRAGAPPWVSPDRYIANSPIFQVGRVRTPIMLVQGENDFIPVQQAEEYFSALYRQNKRAELVRYYGEDHTIGGRANVLDFWRRVEGWLRDTLAPR